MNSIISAMYSFDTSFSGALRPMVRTGDLADDRIGVAMCILFGIAAIIFLILAIRAFKERIQNR